MCSLSMPFQVTGSIIDFCGQSRGFARNGAVPHFGSHVFLR